MKIRYIIVIILIFIGLFAHFVGGELTDIKALMHSEISDIIKIEFRTVWYIVTIDFLISGLFLVVFLSKNRLKDNEVLINFIGIRMLLYGLMFLMLIMFINVDLLFQIPQWILLIIIGILLEWEFITRAIKKK